MPISKTLKSQLIEGSKYFTWHDALWLPAMGAYGEPPDDATKVAIRKLAGNLDRIRDHFDGKPVVIHSWYRPPAYNKAIGGAPYSYHTKGMAVDFHIEGVSIETVKGALYKDKHLWPWRGELDTTTWIHLDMGEGPWFNGMPKRRTGAL